jgi:hypothetical protein
MSWERKGDQIILTLSESDWESLIFAMGEATGSCFAASDQERGFRLVELWNRMNEGRPGFVKGEPKS